MATSVDTTEMGRITDNVISLIGMVNTVCLSPLGEGGEMAGSSDYHRTFADIIIDLSSIRAPDGSGANIWGETVHYRGKKVLDVDRANGRVLVYAPGEWEEHLGLLHRIVEANKNYSDNLLCRLSF